MEEHEDYMQESITQVESIDEKISDGQGDLANAQAALNEAELDWETADSLVDELTEDITTKNGDIDA